jgi:hypothetical protein
MKGKCKVCGLSWQLEVVSEYGYEKFRWVCPKGHFKGDIWFNLVDRERCLPPISWLKEILSQEQKRVGINES